MTRRTRLIVAGLVAPPIGIAALAALIAALLTPNRPGAGVVQSAFDGGFYLLFFGAPIAYVLELAVGLPAYNYLRARSRLSLLMVTGVAAVMGVVLLLLASGAVTSGAPRDWLVAAGLGAVAGTVSGLTFWAVGLFPGRSRPGLAASTA
jgi:hypothetical protein